MYNTTFEFPINMVDFVFIKASCTDVSNWASNLRISWPKDFKPTREVADQIEEMAVEKLREEKTRGVN